MSWQEGAAVTVVLLGLGAGAFLVAQQPSFWIEFGSRLGNSHSGATKTSDGTVPLIAAFHGKRLGMERREVNAV